MGGSHIPTATAVAQAQATAVAAAQQHRQPSYDVLPVSIQPPNSASQATSIASPPPPGRSSPHVPLPGQAPAAPQSQTTQSSATPLSKQQGPKVSPSGQTMTPPRSQGKTPPRDTSGKNLGNANTQAHSPASQGDQSSSSGYGSATENKPNLQTHLQSIKTEQPSPPPSQPQLGQNMVILHFLFIIVEHK